MEDGVTHCVIRRRKERIARTLCLGVLETAKRAAQWLGAALGAQSDGGLLSYTQNLMYTSGGSVQAYCCLDFL